MRLPSLSLRLLSAVALVASAFAPAAQAAVVYSLAGNSTQLIRFDTANPAAVTTIGAISGATTGLSGLDFRPADGKLYGYALGNLYTVDTATGVTTFVSSLTTPANSNLLGIDFNPVADRLRIVTDTDQNLRVNVATGATTVDGPLAYAAGDVNAGANPNIIDAAYTNSDVDPATGTALFYIDYVLDILVGTSNPNGGVLSTIGALGFDIDVFTGFDILTSNGTNFGLATFRVGGIDGLYNVNLATGAATLVGAIGASELFGLAVVQEVPEPGSLALLGAAALAVFAARRRRVASCGAIAA